MHALVTGGAGHIGSTLAGRLVHRFGSRVTVLDDLSTGSADNLDAIPAIELIRCNVNEQEQFRLACAGRRFDMIFHLAAVVGVQRTLANPMAVFADIRGIENVVALAAEQGVRRLLFASSSEVYGEPVAVPLHESTTPINSRLPYAIVKTLGEAYLKASRDAHGLRTTIFRLFNTFGPRQSEDFVIPRFLSLALARQPIPINGDGTQTRTFCYVDDVVDAMLEIVAREAFVDDTVNIGSDREVTVRQLAETITALTGSNSPIVHRRALPEGDVSRRVPDISRLRSIFDKELVSLEAGIGRLIAARLDEQPDRQVQRHFRASFGD